MKFWLFEAKWMFFEIEKIFHKYAISDYLLETARLDIHFDLKKYININSSSHLTNGWRLSFNLITIDYHGLLLGMKTLNFIYCILL